MFSFSRFCSHVLKELSTVKALHDVMDTMPDYFLFTCVPQGGVDALQQEGVEGVHGGECKA